HCGSIRFPGPPFRMSRTPLRTRRPAPALGGGEKPKRRGLFPEATRAESREPRRALEGIRVLDFTHVVAGPVATRILADHGAEVVKIERKTTLDQGDRRRGFFSNLNRGKKSVILDLSTPRGIEVARRLAAKSDVVIDNFSARVMPNLGLDYDALRQLRKDVIAVSMSGFGKTGPHRDYVSFGPTLQALCGHTMLMRHGEGEPAGWGFSHADMCGGLTGAIAVLAALRWRARSGEGQFVDLAQYESVVSFMGPALLALVENGTEIEPRANRSQEGDAVPHGVYRCAGADRWIAIAVGNESEWRGFAEAVAQPWTKDPRLVNVDGRRPLAAEIDAALAEWTAIRSPEEVMLLLQRHGVPAYVVANGEDLCARDPQLQARGYWVRLPHEDGGVAVVDGIPPRLSRTPGRIDAAGPRHGEHTDAVLAGVAGY
ncbi:MAG: CoA transferase, partial [Candidatus Binatia bacterium]